jgi:hypothetical protein
MGYGKVNFLLRGVLLVVVLVVLGTSSSPHQVVQASTTRGLKQLMVQSVDDAFSPDAFNVSLSNATSQNKNLALAGSLGEALVG